MLRRFAQLIAVVALVVVAEDDEYFQEERDGRVLLVPEETIGRSLQARTCDSLFVPACDKPSNRDVIFVVDASDSLDPQQFYTSVLDFVQSSWCGFNSSFVNRGALITFGRQVNTHIPFANYTAEEWFQQVENVRADTTACCSCCTPTAEALRTARKLLKANQPQSEDTKRVVMLITDGDPWQNQKGSEWRFPKVKPATYKYKVVPQQAKLLKDLDGEDDAVKLMVIGVPNKNGQPPDTGYVTGSNVLGKKHCVRRARVRECLKVPTKAGNFPIASEPIDENVFVSTNWDVAQLIDLTSDSLCMNEDSLAPTASPSLAPTTSPVVTASG